MPTYDYVCDACKHEFEHFQGINDPLLKKCPKCKKSKLRRLFGTGAALMFKGSGFYITDYRSEGYKQAAAADKTSTTTPSDSGTAAKSESKAEAKPASGGTASSSGGSTGGKTSGAKSSAKKKK